ncbi:hypothetical protein DLAC_01358 [Tieghemostelium lacteum]|uniref:Uncharacterized protein n=1 Tax=Tieghemostelium lacteum TaxID=361077 RepID=A0A152A8G8_TIELA|nr:hypothetical protein DLAC_01358 [Tieghemostelium lacteum]|eukprot:KYR02512.1 hypothetical protein DLAC_01358 [Tieghemostelium lacteum]
MSNNHDVIKSNNEFSQICKLVNKQLDNRENKYEELLNKGILKNHHNVVSPGIQLVSSQLKFQKTTSTLDRKLENRPSINDLFDHHIIENSPLLSNYIAPSLHSKKKYLEFLQTQSQLLQKLDNRPTPSQMILSTILKNQFDDNSDLIESLELPSSQSLKSNNSSIYDNFLFESNNNTLDDSNNNDDSDSLSSSSSISSSLSSYSSSISFLSASDLFHQQQRSQRTLGSNSFDETVKILNSKLQNRINKELLIQNGILKSRDIAPSIQATQNQLKFQKITISNNLEKRLVHYDLLNGIHMDTNSNVNTNSNINQTINKLNSLVESRPSIDDLYQHNILIKQHENQQTNNRNSKELKSTIKLSDNNGSSSSNNNTIESEIQFAHDDENDNHS